MAGRFNSKNFAIRFLFALALVAVSYNPEGFSYFHWLRDTLINEGIRGVSPLLVLAGSLLAIGWIIYIRATMRSLGPHGVALIGGVGAAILWTLVYYDIVQLNSFRLVAYLVIVGVSLVLAIGLSWSHVRRRLSGQVDTDDVDNN